MNFTTTVRLAPEGTDEREKQVERIAQAICREQVNNPHYSWQGLARVALDALADYTREVRS